MADVIAKLQVDAGQFDQNLKKAVEQMTKMEQEVRRVGATFAVAYKEDIEFVKSIGELGTKSTTAKQQLREYTDAITSLTATYRAMTDEEKNSATGNALAASIDQIKVKAAQLNDIMADTNREIHNLASDTSFTDGLNMMTRTIGASASAIVAWTGDSKEMEAVIKELAKIGTTVAAVDQLTKAFQKQNLVLLKNPYVIAAAGVATLAVAIGKLIKKSQELSAVDKALQDVQQKGRENSAMEITRIDTLNNILHDNTRSLDERKAALSEIQALVPEYHGALTTEGNLIDDNTDSLTAYINNLQRAATAQAAFDRMVEINKQKLEKQLALNEANKKLTTAQEDYNRPVSRDEMLAQAGSGRNVYGSVANTKKTILDAAQSEVNGLEAEIKEFNKEIETLQTLVNSSALGTQGGKTGGNGGGVSTPEIIYPSELGTGAPGLSMFEQLQRSVRIKLGDQNFEIDQNSLTNLLMVAMQHGIDSLNPDFEHLQQMMAEGFDIPDEAWVKLQDEINAALKGLHIDPIVIDVKTGGVQTASAEVKEVGKDAKQVRADFVAAASAVSALGGALQQIDDPATKIAGIVAQAVANIALGFAAATASPVTTAAGVFGWIAAATTGLATMISTISAIKSVTSSAKGYAEGGIVGGTTYSGDQVVARLNSGEGVLTRTGIESAAKMASAFDGRGGAAPTSTPYVSGENIVLGVNNFLGRSGKGEIVTTQMLRRAGINL